ncbi:hypothetical protein [Methylotenera sp.]|uniref:hypothetical protein n=1 Tax=Methylotenera sp. TaxID=2051956 RepID=UPI002732140C|nr:hypothetical protein [Methylotenera sp.]MDP2231460.1 hypothetical protein [Methylotenera sp.]MDP3141232.1 hypothetical protein [Methylotenera sp.]
MKRIIFIVAVVLIPISLGRLYLIESQGNEVLNNEITLLERAGDQCVGISERAIAAMAPVVEFQKLELISRQANVLKQCMKDHGFHESLVWKKYAEPLANLKAAKEGISVDEALESIRRTDMQNFKPKNQKPQYWARLN